MKVIEKQVGKFQDKFYANYIFNNGYEYVVYANIFEFGHTTKGNYTKINTTRKLCKLASEWESAQIKTVELTKE